MATARYANPVWPGYFADPFVLTAAERYYAFGTGGGTPNVLLGLTSADLVTWTDQSVLLRPEELGDGVANLWAPAVARMGEEYVMYFSAGVGISGHGLRIATSRSPGGPYTALGPSLTPDEPFAIDPHPFEESDGEWYLFYAVNRRDGARIGTRVVVDRLLEPGRLAGDPQPVVVPSADWQLYEPERAADGRDWHTCEGPFVVFRHDRYWCLYSGGSWERPSYGVSVASAPHPLGPWTEVPAERPTVIRTSPAAALGPGHVSVVTDDAGEDWLVYHAWDLERSARRMCIDPLRWTPDGPVCDGPSAGRRPAPVTGRSRRRDRVADLARARAAAEQVRAGLRGADGVLAVGVVPAAVGYRVRVDVAGGPVAVPDAVAGVDVLVVRGAAAVPTRSAAAEGT